MKGESPIWVPWLSAPGKFTGRSPNDRFLVKEKANEKNIWWSKENVPVTEEVFDRLHAKMLAYFQGRDAYVQDCYVGADTKYRLPLRVVTDTAWQKSVCPEYLPKGNQQAQAGKLCT